MDDARRRRNMHQVQVHRLRGRVSGRLFPRRAEHALNRPRRVSIDCAVCIPECPVNAIYAEEDVPEDQRDFIPLNVELSKQWPSITRMKPHPPDADDWKDIRAKRHLLER